MTNIITNTLDTITNGTNIYLQHQIIQTITEKNTVTSWGDPALWVTIIGSLSIPIILAILGYIYQKEMQDRQLITQWYKNSTKIINKHESEYIQKFHQNFDENTSYDYTEDLNNNIRLMYDLLNNDLLLFQIQSRSRRKLIKEVCEILKNIRIKKADSNLTESEAVELLNMARDMGNIYRIVLWNNRGAVKKLKQYYINK